MADRQWFVEGVQVYETGEEEYLVEGVQVTEDQPDAGGGGTSVGRLINGGLVNAGLVNRGLIG